MKTPRFESVIKDLLERYLHRAEDRFDWEIETQESPIEKVFMAAMLAGGWESTIYIGQREFNAALDSLEAAGLTWEDRQSPASPIRFFVWEGTANHAAVSQPTLQLKERRIRPDFAFVLSGPGETKLIVELDGHDFHERTPEQAQSDKSRDRELQAMGWHVLRFTGREVLRDPSRCLDEVESLMRAKLALIRAADREAAK